MSPEFTLKVGDTLLARCVHRDDNGTPINLTAAGITITSAVRKSVGFQTYPVTVTPDPDQIANPGVYICSADTSNWLPDNLMNWDVRYNQGSNSFSTRTIIFALQERIS